MHNEFKNGQLVMVYGPGKNNGNFYKNQLAVIVLRDPYFKDYQVKFENDTEDWISPEYIQKIS